MPNNNNLRNDPNDQEFNLSDQLIKNPYKENCPVISEEQNELLNTLAAQIGDIQKDLKELHSSDENKIDCINCKLNKTYLTLGFLYNTFHLKIPA